MLQILTFFSSNMKVSMVKITENFSISDFSALTGFAWNLGNLILFGNIYPSPVQKKKTNKRKNKVFGNKNKIPKKKIANTM